MDTRDWNLCFICQANTNEAVTDPANSVKLRGQPQKVENCYQELLDNISVLRDLDELPNFVEIDDIDLAASSALQVLISNHAVWHKNCRSSINKQKVERAKSKTVRSEHHSPVKTRRMSSPGVHVQHESHEARTENCSLEPKCLFCDGVGDQKDMRKASTLGLNQKVTDAARKIGDARLLGKLIKGDMIAIGAMYHRSCLSKLYRNADAVDHATTESYTNRVLKAQVLNELLEYIEDHRGSGTVLSMAKLTALYDKRLAQIGGPPNSCHTTRLRLDIMSMIPDIQAIENSSGSWNLAFNEDFCELIMQMKENLSGDMKNLAQAARILRQDILHKKQTFSGSFSSSSERDSVVPTLQSFLHMLLDGAGIDVEEPPASSEKIVVSLAEAITYNCVGKRSKKAHSCLRHPRERETPMPLMLAMKAHMTTGKESLVDLLAERGICVSYDRLRQVTTDIANSVISKWEEQGGVVPTQSTKGIFTTGGADNIDYNPSSTTATSQSVLHGTSISILQHFPTNQKEQDEGPILRESEIGQRTVKPLPLTYTSMEDISYHQDEIVHVPVLHDVNSHPVPASRSLQMVLQEGYAWLEHVNNHVGKPLEKEEWISWAAYHAVHSQLPSFRTRSHMLPLLTESSNSPTTMFHSMKIICFITENLNPGQTPVMVVDQPLFTLAKRLQWKFNDTYIAEDRFLVMLGAMHIEKMLWTVSGDWLDGSGWTTAITNSCVATSGTAQSLIGASHICRTRYVHQVSVTALYTLLRKAYHKYIQSMQDESTASTQPADVTAQCTLQEWIQQKRASQPQADFWFKSVELDLLILQVKRHAHI